MMPLRRLSVVEVMVRRLLFNAPAPAPSAAAFGDQQAQSSSSQRREQAFSAGAVDSIKKRALNVAVIGSPNVGKSALTNRLIKAEVCAVSKLIDTTRENMIATLTENECQLVVVDSPGVIGTGHAKKLMGVDSDDRTLSEPEDAMMQAEHVLVVCDATAPGQDIHHRVLHLLHRYAHIPSTLVINKIDLIDRRTDLFRLANTLTQGTVDGQPIPAKRAVQFGRLGTLPTATHELKIHQTDGIQDKDEEWHRLYGRLLRIPTHKCGWSDTRRVFFNHKGWPNFKAVFFVSTKSGEGIDGLRQYLRELASPLPRWHFDPESITPKKPRQVCVEHVRSALLNGLPGNIAYNLWPKVVDWQVDDVDQGPLRITVDVNCEKERWARLTMKIADTVERTVKEQCQQLFKMPVEFRLNVRHKGKLQVEKGDSIADAVVDEGEE